MLKTIINRHKYEIFKNTSLTIIFGCFSWQGTEVANQNSLLENPDSTVNCKNIKEGEFLRNNYPEGIWYMTIKDNVQTEYSNGGKDYIKSNMVFIDDCNYKTMVTEKSDKNDPTQIGDVVINKVMQTEKNLLRINSKIDGQSFEKILIKVK